MMLLTETLSQGKKNQAKTRLLLALFEAEQPVIKSQLTKRIVPKKEKAADYQIVFDELLEIGAIEKSKKGYSLIFPKGLEILNENLNSKNFVFEGTIIGTWVANALLNLIKSKDNTSKYLHVESELIDNTKTFEVSKGSGKTQEFIDSYEEFESQVMKLFEKLDKGYNYSGLVPIWHLRRELGQQVNPEKFNDWMMEMQASQLLYLQSGEARGASEDQKRDSIHSEIRGLLFFASKLS